MSISSISYYVAHTSKTYVFHTYYELYPYKAFGILKKAKKHSIYLIRGDTYMRKIYSILTHPNIVLGLFTLLLALIVHDQGPSLWQAYLYLITQSVDIQQDFIQVAGLPAALLNVSLHFFIAYAIFYCNQMTKVTGFRLTSTALFTGHAFFGTHILNIIPIIMGVYLYSHHSEHNFRHFATVSLFATAAAPIISHLYVMFPNPFGILLSLILGGIIGFIIPPLGEHFLHFHQGFTLYNLGFTVGIVAMICSQFPPFTHLLEANSIVASQSQSILWFYLLGIWIIIAVYFITSKANPKHHFKELIQTSGRVPTDFTGLFGFRLTSFNILITSGIYLVILFLMKVPLSGQIVAGIFAITGMSSFGLHFLNTLPISAGVVFSGYLLQMPLTDPGLIVSALFATGLAPITGTYGIIPGLISGAIHLQLTEAVFDLHSGFNVYNNGFASGFVAAVLVPILDTLVPDKNFN